MSERSKFLVSGGRALTGLLITGAAAAGVVMLSVAPLPSVERAPHAITVDTKQTNERDIVCSGAFSELGADPSRPDLAVPLGSASVVTAGNGALSTLNTASVLTGAATAAIAAAQTQTLSSPTLSGLVASSCVEPSNEQWIVGGQTTLGLTTTLNLGNASEVAATVQISVFDSSGEIADFQTAGVIVAPRSEQIVSLNGYAPNREALAVRVTSTGAPIAASMGVSRIEGLEPSGAATVTRQMQPQTQLVFPGLTNVFTHDHGDDRPGDAGPADAYPVRVQALTPGDAEGTADVYAIDAAGKRVALGSIELQARTLGELVVETWPTDATALIIESDVPVFGGAEATAASHDAVDFDWFAPSQTIAADSELAAVVVPGGSLFFANTGSLEAEVTIQPMTGAAIAGEDAAQQTQTVRVAPGAAVQVEGAGSFKVLSDQPIHSGVRLLAEGTLAGYPIAPLTERGGALTVYTR